MKDLSLADFPFTTFDKVRYGDTDRQGHVNNAAFSTFLETGRVEFLIDLDNPLLAEGASFVIVSLELSFLGEINWPGKVDIGSGVLSVGRSSIKLYQHLYQNDALAASAHTTIVQVKEGKSSPLTESAKERLAQWMLAGSTE